MEEILKGKRKKLEEDTGIIVKNYSHQQRLNERALEKVM